MDDKKGFRVVGVFDTETTNIEITPGEWRAFPVLYICNDLRGVELTDYSPDCPGEDIRLYRHDWEFHAWVNDLIQYGIDNDLVPVIAAYNLAFDLQSVIYELTKGRECKALARSSTNIYTLDIIEDGEPVLRFWDSFHLETGGLSQMGRICGFGKASGDWNYSLIRTPDTELTDEEIGYARRDVQVIPAYMRYLLDTGQVADAREFGHRIITKTSIVRQMARYEIGALRADTGSGNSTTIRWLFEGRCKRELPYSYECYALRKACFRGGFTFTAAATASTIRRNVSSFDVTSMHHLYINGRRVPVDFLPASIDTLKTACNYIMNRSLEAVLRRYDCPFAHMVNVVIEFENIRLKRGSVFERSGIALLAAGKFSDRERDALDFEPDVRNVVAENMIRAAGFHDTADGAVFAFGKLVSADRARIHLTELELWNVAQVYEWDSYEVITGEHTIKSAIPPDYVSLQSNVLYRRKNDAKHINAAYEGAPYHGSIPDTIPSAIADELRAGTMDPDTFSNWYGVSVKGSYNGIYGTQAQDQLRPDFVVSDGEFEIEESSKLTPDNFFERLPDRSSVLYTYGARIVGGSRMHLVIGMMLLDRVFGDRIQVLGGDTDSYKIAHPKSVKPEDIVQAFAPLHEAADRAIGVCQQRIRSNYPELAADFSDLGHFDYEGTQDVHFEAWNKARVSFTDGKAHITCAGLMRPPGYYHIENWIEEMIARGFPLEDVLEAALAYNGVVDNSVCHAREHYRPGARDRIRMQIEDYRGDVSTVDCYEAVAIFPAAREVGGMVKDTNLQNVRYLEREYGRHVPKREHYITRENGRAELYIADDWGELRKCDMNTMIGIAL